MEAEKDLVFVSFDTSVLPEGTEYGKAGFVRGKLSICERKRRLWKSPHYSPALFLSSPVFAMRETEAMVRSCLENTFSAHTHTVNDIPDLNQIQKLSHHAVFVVCIRLFCYHFPNRV